MRCSWLATHSHLPPPSRRPTDPGHDSSQVAVKAEIVLFRTDCPLTATVGSLRSSRFLQAMDSPACPLWDGMELSRCFIDRYSSTRLAEHA